MKQNNTQEKEQYKVCISDRTLVTYVVEKLRKLNMVTVVTVEDFDGRVIHQFADHPFRKPADCQRKLCEFLYKQAAPVLIHKKGNLYIEVPWDIITPGAKRIFKMLHYID